VKFTFTYLAPDDPGSFVNQKLTRPRYISLYHQPAQPSTALTVRFSINYW